MKERVPQKQENIEQDETSFIFEDEDNLRDLRDEEKYQNLPENHPLRKMWGKIKRNVRASDIVMKNEKITFLKDNLDIKVYRLFFKNFD